MNTAIHTFEKAGLGIAPFYCTGMFSIPSPSMAADNPTAYNNAMSMLPRGMGAGSCAYCGMSITHNFMVKDSTDRRFVVGSECVNRTGDAGMIKTVKAERSKIAKEKRAARNAIKRDEREAMWKLERDRRAADFIITHASLIERTTPFMKDGGFIFDVINGGKNGRFISDKAIAAVTRVIDQLEQRAIWKANSRHFGEVGKRVALNVFVDRIASYDRPSYAGFGHETVWIITLRDDNGNAFVSKSTAFYAERDTRLTIKATIKEHSSYDGEQQTIVQRIKVA